MRHVSSRLALPVAVVALFSASMLVLPAPEAAAQATPTAKPAVAPTPPAVVKPAGTATAPRAGGFPLELAGGLVAGGSALATGGLLALRRRKRAV